MKRQQGGPAVGQGRGRLRRKIRSGRELVVNRAVERAFPWFERIGLHVVRNQFYNPIPDTRRLDDAIFEGQSKLVGMRIDTAKQLDRLESFRERFRKEYQTLPRRPAPKAPVPSYFLENSSYGPVDAELWYCMLRWLKPKRVIEVGSGFSTLLALQAIERNEESGAHTKYTVIDPYPSHRVQYMIAAGASLELLRSPVQGVALDRFDTLKDGDVLFIDSTHVAAIGSDVCYEYLEVLPRLAKGVYVHVHDILLPENYPREWVQRLYFWNEQYLLQAFLTFNDTFEIVWSARQLSLDEPQALAAAFPSFRPGVSRPGCFWMRRVR